MKPAFSKAGSARPLVGGWHHYVVPVEGSFYKFIYGAAGAKAAI